MDVEANVITELKANLVEAMVLPGGVPLLERNRARLALSATLDFLDKIEIPAEMYGPLFGILTALQDCENGKTPLLFEVEAKRGSPGDSIDASQVKAFAAAAMEYLMKNRRMGKKEAGSLVAREISFWGPEASRLLNRRIDVESWKTIASWRDAVKKGDSYATKTYYEILKSIRNRHPFRDIPATEIANIILVSCPFWVKKPKSNKST